MFQYTGYIKIKYIYNNVLYLTFFLNDHICKRNVFFNCIKRRLKETFNTVQTNNPKPEITTVDLHCTSRPKVKLKLEFSRRCFVISTSLVRPS